MDLHYYMSDTGRVLSTRSRGKQVSDHLRELSLEVEEGEKVIIDFSKVEVTSAPFLQEVLETLEDRFSGQYEIVAMNEDVSETLAFVQNR
jgi:hypothetical protein